MVPIMNKPLIERTITNLKNNGVTQIVISSCYQSHFLKNHFGNGERFGLEIEYVVEDIPLGTGGAIKKAGAKLSEAFIVFNSDVLSDIDINKMIALHRSSKALATIAAVEVENPSAYGVIEYDENGFSCSIVCRKAGYQKDHIKAYQCGDIYFSTRGNRPTELFARVSGLKRAEDALMTMNECSSGCTSRLACVRRPR